MTLVHGEDYKLQYSFWPVFQAPKKKIPLYDLCTPACSSTARMGSDMRQAAPLQLPVCACPLCEAAPTHHEN